MSEKISCGIARDLMPLVIDDACGEESRLAVEGHIAGCEECAKVYEAMKTEIPKPAADEKENAHFAQSMKKTRRKSRWIKIACGILAAILLLVTGWNVTHPGPLFAEKTTVPVSWIHDAQLVRTSDGYILLQFTPDEKYRMYMGAFPSRTELVDGIQLDVSFQYSDMARKLNVRPPVTEENEVWNQFDAEIRHNGNMIIPIRFFYEDWRYENGAVRQADWREATEAELASMNLPERRDGKSYYVYDYLPAEETGSRLELVISDGKKTLPVYASGDVIPLIDPELEKAVRRILNYPDIGEVSNGMGP